MKRVIVGGPRVGKTTYAKQLDSNAVSTDQYVNGNSWDQQIEHSAKHLGAGDGVVEGVQTVRALRLWLERHPLGKPCDEVLVLTRPKVEQTPGQHSMTKGVETVLRKIQPELEQRGVKITMVEA